MKIPVKQIETSYEIKFNWHAGYVVVRNRATKNKLYHGIIWDGPNPRMSRKKFEKAKEAADYGHEARARLRALRKVQNSAPDTD